MVGKRVFLRECRLESKGWLIFFSPSSFSCLCGFVCTCCACVDYGVNRLKILVLCLFFVFEGAFDLLGKLMGLNLFFVFCKNLMK